MSALLNCAQAAGADNKHIAKVTFPRIMVSPFQAAQNPTPGWMQILHNRLRRFEPVRYPGVLYGRSVL
jgi:hypothetical protein